MDVSINAKMTAQYTLCSVVNNSQRENHLSEKCLIDSRRFFRPNPCTYLYTSLKRFDKEIAEV